MKACRKIAGDEQQKFFDGMTVPTINLGSALASARAEVTKLSAFRSEAAKAAMDLRQKQAARNETDRLVAETENDLANAPAANRPALEDLLKKRKKAATDADNALDKARIELKKLEA